MRKTGRRVNRVVMKFQLKRHHRNVPSDELICDLQRIQSCSRKQSFTGVEYKTLGGKFDVRTFARRFGTWSKALQMAGVGTRVMNVPEKELLENLAAVWTTLGRQPTYRQMAKPISQYDATTYKRRFGTWAKALEKFVEWANTDQKLGLQPEAEPAAPNTARRRTPRDANLRLRFKVMQRDGFKCLCGRSPATDPAVTLEIDHITPWSKGGETVLENLQTLCRQCNSGKSDLV